MLTKHGGDWWTGLLTGCLTAALNNSCFAAQMMISGTQWLGGGWFRDFNAIAVGGKRAAQYSKQTSMRVLVLEFTEAIWTCRTVLTPSVCWSGLQDPVQQLTKHSQLRCHSIPTTIKGENWNLSDTLADGCFWFWTHSGFKSAHSTAALQLRRGGKKKSHRFTVHR